MSHTTRLSGAVARTAVGRSVNQLAPSVLVVSAQRYASRAARRHTRTGSGATVNIPRARQAPALNVPFRRGRVAA